ncbi:MAG: hypothetical protein P4M07_15140 [Xanthobacteraceae bacterium]|nr:hypothetical protein [Xanthobacteraceae bacterium]
MTISDEILSEGVARGIISPDQLAALLVLGAFVLVLSAGWRPLRGMLLHVTPAAVTHRLPQASLQS